MDYRTGKNTIPDSCFICHYTINLKSRAALKLNRCRHIIHMSCGAKILQCQSVTTYFQCPIGKKIQGNQLLGGKMTATKSRKSLPGFPRSEMLTITYDFDMGIQGQKHPNPSKPYGCHGFPRPAYLPDTAAGRKVLLMLEQAFERCLIFTVGHSLTTGRDDIIIWNGISHKTFKDVMNSPHGFPVANYLTKVLKELKDHGKH